MDDGRREKQTDLQKAESVKQLRKQAKDLKKKAREIESEIDNKGLRCPKCNCAHFETDKTVPVAGRRIRRYKVCRHCGRRVRTTERIEE